MTQLSTGGPQALRNLAIHEVTVRGTGEPPGAPLPLREARDRFEQAYVLRALESENWNQSRAARRLGVHRNTLLARPAAWGTRRRDGAAEPDAPAAGSEAG